MSGIEKTSAIQRAVEMLGGQTKLGQMIGKRQSVINNWVNRDKQTPAKYIKKVSDLTNGEISIVQLLADHEVQRSQEA